MSVQIVFLVDTDLKNNVRSSTVLTKSICLSCIRLLSHLSSYLDKNGVTRNSKQNYQKLKWGYKFFNTKTHHTRIESHKLYDFKVRHFEEFENELLRKFQNVDTTKGIASKRFKPADSLNKAFTEILADFKWESQDFWSPIKGKHLRKDCNEKRHLVVLFTNCPKNFQQLKEFTGKRVLDEEIFLNSLFPNTLFEQFCQIAKLNLYWIDTHCNETIQVDIDLQALEIVQKSVEKTGGGVASLQAVADYGCPYFTNIQGLLEEEGQDNVGVKCPGQSFQLLPLATVAKSFAFPSDNKLLQKDKKLQDEKCIAIQIGNKTLEVLATRQIIVNHVNISQRKTSPPGNENDSSYLQSDVLQGYAVLKKSLLGCSFPVVASYLCSEKVKADTGNTTAGYVEGMLGKVVLELVSRNCILVLVCNKTGQLILMEPLTSHTATLSVLSVDNTLCVEKQLLLQATCKQTISGTDEDKQKFVDEMVDKLVGSIHVARGNDVGECVEGKHLDGLQLDRHVVPGCSKSVQNLISKLNERISELDFLSSDEVATLKQLSKSYRKAKQPPGLRDSSLTCNTETKMDAVDKAVVSHKGKTSHVSLSRTDKILFKSKEMVQDNKQKKTVDSVGTKLERDKPDMAAHLADFQTEEELKNYLTSTYERAASGEVTDIDSCIQSMVTVALHYFMLKEDKTCAKEDCKKLLMDTLLATGNQLREKYSQHEQLPLEQKVAEYETQILVRMEMISTLEEKEKTEESEDMDEIVSMLRTLSFISEPGLLSKFMQSSLLHNYMHTIPRTLGNIYDELMQPLPESLANILSPEDASMDQSGLNDESLMSEDGLGPPSARTRSHGSVGPQSNQSVKLDTSLNTSRGSRKLVHHYSMVDFGSKRQIVVDKLPKQKTEKNAKKKIKSSSKRKAGDKTPKSPYDKKRNGVKLQRRQSVAVMERTHKTPKKNTTPSKTAVTPSGRRGRLVAETPCHKQVSSMLNKSLQLQELQMDVIKESPEKSCDISYNNSPTKGKRAKALLRRSFYSAGPTKRTKNLSQYFQLANRIAGRPHPPSPERKKLSKLISFDTPEQFKSPDKNSSFLLTQLGASPSPAKTTPRKFTKTPSKIMDSPSHNTRSKCESPGRGLFGRRSILASPVSHTRQKPSRQQSPRVLVPDSGVKKGPELPQTTPEKSPVIGVVTLGLDSPSQNTRQKHAQTPTRKSVRAALFAKSPVAKNHSPFRAKASPRTLLDKFGSPVKARAVGSPVKSVNTLSIDKTMSPLRNEHPHSLRTGKNPLQFQVSNLSNKLNMDNQLLDEKHSNCAKTPSPKVKKVAKTPDSFDKWRRMKPRMSQPSPSVKIPQKATITNQETIDIIGNVNLNQSKASLLGNQSEMIEENKIKGSNRRKRTLIQSPEKSVGSFSKRRRTGHDSFMGSQGFDVTGSFNDLSQKSFDSSVDYFSASNDEVFASQDENTENMEIEEYNVENINRASKKRHLFVNECDNERSESPIFGSKSGKTSITQAISDDLEIGQKNSRTRRESGNRSPACLLKSPGNKKYSPNVSAKSLMHLIQSPLLKSPEGETGKNSSKLMSPRSKAIRSRRSLILNN